MFILVTIYFYIIEFFIKYLLISKFGHINFISGYFSQIYLLMVSLTISSLAMFNFAINILTIFILAKNILLMFILSIINFLHNWFFHKIFID